VGVARGDRSEGSVIAWIVAASLAGNVAGVLVFKFVVLPWMLRKRYGK
jgi:hypothetical protein